MKKSKSEGPLGDTGDGPDDVHKFTPKAKAEAENSQWLEFLNLGWVIAGTMTVMVGGGLWLDSHYKTTPILLLVGTFLGFAGCGYSLYRMIQKLNGSDRAKPRK